MTRRLLTALFGAWLALAGSRMAGAVDPIVVLVSFDGWRSDYIDRVPAPRLRALAARGVRAKYLIPVFPPTTFPNHYTIVTGLFPARHGIVSNNIADPSYAERFTMPARTALDPRWWNGEAIWTTAMHQGKRTGSMFWPGSEVAGKQPTYWRPFDDNVPNDARVHQVLEWLALPAAQRPSFITLYFSEVDHAGHDFGPDSPELHEAAGHLDAALGDLVAGIDRLQLSDWTTVVVVSDHGMAATSDDRVIFLDDFLDLSTIDVVEWSPNLQVVPQSDTVEHVYQALRDRHPALRVFRRDNTPLSLHYRDNSRIAPIVGLADDGWTITTHQRAADDRTRGRVSRGNHGYDPALPSMRALFVAAGPRLRQGIVVDGFENIQLYAFLCELLNITPAPNDGDFRHTRSFFNN